MQICVFCGSSPNIGEPYVSAMRELGLAIGRGGHSLVFGGYATGLMKVAAEAVHEAGGRVFGVAVESVGKFEGRAELGDEVVHATDMTDRKYTMIRRADAFVAGPGAYGTLDELYEVLVDQKLGGGPRKPIVLFNVGGLYDGLVVSTRKMCEDGIMTKIDLDRVFVSDNVADIMSHIETFNAR